MSKFKTRLKYYLIGFGLGLVFMFFIFGNRACSWLPENRVKNMLAEKEIIIGDSVADLMKCQEVTNSDVYRFLDDDGDVNFGKSQTKNEPREYWIEGVKDNEDLTIIYALHDDFAEVIGFEFQRNNCSSNLSNQNKSVVPLPDEEVRAIIDSKEMRILNEASCQIDCLGLNEGTVRGFHKKATFVVEKSAPREQPNPYYVMQAKVNGEIIEIKYVIGENRTRVADIRSASTECNCD